MKGFTPKYGARPLRGVIRSDLRSPLSKMLISGELKKGGAVKLDLDDNKELKLTRKGNLPRKVCFDLYGRGIIKEDLAFYFNYLKDNRYIRINGSPLLLVYRPNLLPSPKETAQRWRSWCRENDIGEIYLAYTQSFEVENPAETTHPPIE